MRKITKIAVLASCLISGCGGSSKTTTPVSENNSNGPSLCAAQAIPDGAVCVGVDGRQNLIFGETSKEYKGLIITLHGAPGYMAKVADIFNANMLEEKGYLVISPNGNGSAWQWDSNTDANIGDDSNYIANLIDYAHANYTVEGDKARIFGYSAGGFMAYTLACHIPEKLVGIVALAGQYRGDFAACSTTTAVAIHHLHSPTDMEVPVNGRASGNIKSVEDTINHWLSINGCAAQFEQITHPAVTTDSSGTVTNSWQQCATPVAFSKLFTVPHESDYLSDALYEIYQSSMALEN
ncbi:prolyl oligopeptidase family serine peptidase [Pseudoalteromonas sp. MMG024]|uniref:alpha/beta hydrolase family esterase n=1 Tax=Pseudoalteromonas sp. MMG024 TaxID=2909980 RepID=UPI001F02AED8|nr:prolyl oligopeptidase family serine peptidase [Pseudoalteromonas sp. MMG024]MCF6458931.1 prolyl oligopeptidase family serine peptidase [Pseudoalteromonas sp. MMG024]